MPKFNFELLRTFILNFWYIHSKRRKKYICTRYLKRQFIYPNKKIATNSLILIIFNVTWPFFFKHLGTRRPEDLPSDGRALLSERLKEAT